MVAIVVNVEQRHLKISAVMKHVAINPDGACRAAADGFPAQLSGGGRARIAIDCP